jgi:hypothetical protein
LEKLFLEENELEEYETDLINWRKNYGWHTRIFSR